MPYIKTIAPPDANGKLEENYETVSGPPPRGKVATVRLPSRTFVVEREK